MTIIKFYPYSEDIINFVDPPQPRGKSLPEWYKRQSANLHNDEDMAAGIAKTTIKKCMPIFDGITAGYLFTMPCDVYVDATDSEKLIYSIPHELNKFKGDIFAAHSRQQYEDYPIDPKEYHRDLLRINPLYVVGTEKGYSTLFTQPLNGDITPIHAFSAILDTDMFISSGYFSFLVKKNFKGIIKQGTPLLQIIPFKREQFTSEVMTPQDTKRVTLKQSLTVRSVFTNGYKNKLRQKKDYR
jgi:hypothetical protein